MLNPRPNDRRRLFKFIENFTFKNWKFPDKNYDTSHISAPKQIVGTRLNRSNEYPQFKFLSRNKKIFSI